MAYTKYSLTPADNNAAPPNGAPEGMLPSAVNDTMRDMMAQIRDVGDGIRGGTYTMTAPVITGGSISGTTPITTSGNVSFDGGSFVFNETGADKDARFEGDTDANLLFLDASTDRIGIGTSSPSNKLDIYASSSVASRLFSDDTPSQIISRASTDTGAPQIQLYKHRGTHVSPTIVASGDSTGRLQFFGYDGAALRPTGEIRSEVDGTPGASDMPGRLVFYTTADGAASITERMRITSSGNLLVGTTSGSDKLTVAGASSLFTNTAGSQTLTLSCRNNVADFARLSLSVPGFDSSTITYDRNNSRLTVVNSSVGVYLASGGNSWTGVSDERVKENLVPITDAVNKVSTLRSVTGNYIKDENKKSRSFLIAQDVQAVLPEAVDSANPEELGVSYTDVIPLLVAAIKELKATVDAQSARIAALESK